MVSDVTFMALCCPIKEYEVDGWTVFPHDLNRRAGHLGWYIYMLHKTAY